MDTDGRRTMTRIETSTQITRRKIGRRISLARQIASKRENREITVEVLAAKLKMFPLRLWEMEEGITGIEAMELSRIGDALDMPPGWFFGQYDWSNCADDNFLSMGDLILAKTINQMELKTKNAIQQIVISILG
jgi:hypothetical protein